MRVYFNHLYNKWLYIQSYQERSQVFVAFIKLFGGRSLCSMASALRTLIEIYDYSMTSIQ